MDKTVLSLDSNLLGSITFWCNKAAVPCNYDENVTDNRLTSMLSIAPAVNNLWHILREYTTFLLSSYSFSMAVYPRTADILVKQSVGMHNPNWNSFFTMFSLGVPECIFAQCKLQWEVLYIFCELLMTIPFEFSLSCWSSGAGLNSILLAWNEGYWLPFLHEILFSCWLKISKILVLKVLGIQPPNFH